jgi:DNA invertase Pin-like site-specific DNA recombinase
MKAPSVKPVRCAIYTRVSTDHGLDQEFNSLDAQYDAASAYIKSQAHAGWTFIRSRYDDGGYSGGSTDRPDLQRLLNGATKMPSGLRASRRARLVLRMDRGKPRKSSPSSAKMSKA